MPTIDRQIFLKDYTSALRDGTAALFVGAGISHAAGFVDWKQLLKEIAEELDLDIDREADLVAIAQYHCNQRQGRDKLNQLLIDEFLEDVVLTPNHHLIASLPLATVWTTNYDDLIEQSYESALKRTDVKRRAVDFATTRKNADVTIYKMHGDKTAPAEAVLIKEDYETYDSTRELFTIALKGDLTMKTFLFIGVGFADPNILYLLSRVKQLLDKDGRKHFCILKKPTPNDYDGAEYDCKRFPHWLNDLRRYNIQPVLVDSYDEVKDLLEELKRRSHQRDVFISGSAADYGPLGEKKFHELCKSLGEELIRNSFNVISGFGVGVGSPVIVGAMQVLRRNDDHRLQLWPFPQEVPAGVDRAEFWKNYREQMISGAGVCIVLCGNKKCETSGEIVTANGVLSEAEIARTQGKCVIPIGATGHVARALWDEIHEDPAAFFGTTEVGQHLEVLGDESSDIASMTQAVIAILKLLDT